MNRTRLAPLSALALAITCLPGCPSTPRYAYTQFSDVKTVSEPAVAASFQSHAITMYSGTAAAFRAGPVGTDGKVLAATEGSAETFEVDRADGVTELDRTTDGRFVLVALRPGKTLLHAYINGVRQEDIPITVLLQ